MEGCVVEQKVIKIFLTSCDCWHQTRTCYHSVSMSRNILLNRRKQSLKVFKYLLFFVLSLATRKKFV